MSAVKRHRVGLGLDVLVTGARSKQEAREAARLHVTNRLLPPDTTSPAGLTVALWDPSSEYENRISRPLNAVHDYSAYVVTDPEPAVERGFEVKELTLLPKKGESS